MKPFIENGKLVYTIRVEHDLTGDLDLRGTAITALPEGLSVGGSLDLRGTAITALPEGLSVGGYLDLSGTAITALPRGLSVVGDVYIVGTYIIEKWPDDFKYGGKIYC